MLNKHVVFSSKLIFLILVETGISRTAYKKHLMMMRNFILKTLYGVNPILAVAV
jgi:uncharacterized membrane-anchored protein